MKIQIYDSQKDLLLSKPKVRSLVKAVIALEGQKCEEVSLHFVDKKTISELHGRFFQDNSPTDCISFPMDDKEESFRVLGEVFVCPSVAIEFASTHDKDPYQETALYVIHGLLHLFGYDDIEAEDRKIMRKMEKKYMSHIQLKGLNLACC